MQRRYFDNAATSFPKPREVMEAMMRFHAEVGASPGRGGYAEAIEAGRIVERCRARLARLVGAESAERVVFTLNATDALNLAIQGLVRPLLKRGERVGVVCTFMEHNSVLRPYHALRDWGVETTFVHCDPETGRVDPDDVRRALAPHVRLVAAIHGSNVTGTLQPVAEIGRLCREAGVPFLVDAAQTLGHLPVSVAEIGCDLLAFPGHKGLLGPTGTGGLYLAPGMEQRVDPIRQGGTGSASESPAQPATMPDRYESGSSNAMGIAGLDAALAWIEERGVASIRAHEEALMTQMMEGLDDLPGLRLLGPTEIAERCGVFSVTCDAFEAAELAALLESRFGILARAGLHCAPYAHETFGTFAGGGATRLSLGPFLVRDDVAAALDALRQLCGAGASAR